MILQPEHKHSEDEEEEEDNEEREKEENVEIDQNEGNQKNEEFKQKDNKQSNEEHQSQQLKHNQEQQQQQEEQEKQQEEEEEQEEEQQESELGSSEDHHNEVMSGLSPIFFTMLQKSKLQVQQTTNKQIKKVKKYTQQKVYLSFSDDPTKYLLHMQGKTDKKQTNFIGQLLLGRQIKIMHGIMLEKYKLKQGNKIKKIQKQVSSKLSQIKDGLSKLEKSSLLEEKSDEVFHKYMQFRKKGYWKEQSQQNKKVKKFISKMHREKRKLEQMHEENLQKEEENAEQKEEQEQEKKEKRKQEHHKQIQQRIQQARKNRKEEREEEKKKLEEASTAVDKYRKEKRAHILLEERYKSQVLIPLEEERKKKLSEIKKIKRPLDSEQFELHQNRYEEFQQRLSETFAKRESDREIEEKNMEKLKELYHGRFHERVEEEMHSYRNLVQAKKKQREKILSYSVAVMEDYKPRVDDKKKEQLEKIIELLAIKSEKGKKKKMVKKEDGTVTFEEIPIGLSKKVGISYLQSLRKLNEGVKRKNTEQRNASMMQVTKKPEKKIYPDYLKQMRSYDKNDNIAPRSKHEWRKILREESFTNREKYNSVMDHVTMLQSEAKQKQIQLKYLKNGTKAIEMKQKLDKYYMESVAAKVHVLKDVMLKDVQFV